MSTFDEVIAAAQANIAALDQARDHIESTKAKAEQARQQAAMLGAERLAHGTQGLIESCREAQGQIAVAKETLQGLVAHTHQLKAYQPGDGGGSATAVTMHSTKGDVDVGHLHTQAIVGDPIQPPQGGPDQPGSLRKELSNADERDRSMNKARRLGRGLARNASDIQSSAKDYAKSSAGSVNDFDPHSYGHTQASVGVPSTSQPTPSAASDARAPDYMGAALVVTVMAVEGLSRIGRKKKRDS